MLPIASTVSWSDRKLFSSSDLSRQETGDDLPKIEPDDVPTVDSSDYLFGPVTPVLAALLPESQERSKAIKAELRAAGYYQPHAWQNLAAVRYLAAVVPMLLCGAALLFVPAGFEVLVMALAVVTPLVGWVLPRLYVQNRAAQRTAEIEAALPDMLDMLTMCVSQGLTVPQSLDRIGRELRPVHAELARELAIISDQSKVGTVRHALENFSRRLDVPEVHAFTSLLIQTERMGTSVAAALIEYSDTMRETLRQRADQKANQAAFKLLFPTVLCLMPAVYLFLLGPATIELSNFFHGGGMQAVDQGAETVERLNRQGP